MKKLFLFATLALFALNVNAQGENETSDGTGGLAKGDIAITGSVGISSQKTGDFDKWNTFSFMPAAGFMVSDNIAVGAKFGIMNTKYEPDSNSENTMNEFMAGVFGQYYFTPANQFSFLATLGAGYTSYKDESTSGGTTSEEKGNGFYAGITPGVNYWISDHFALQAHVGVLGYQTTKPDFDGAESTNNFDFGFNFKNVDFTLVYKF